MKKAFFFVIISVLISLTVKSQETYPSFIEFNEWKGAGFSAYVSLYVSDSCRMKDTVCLKTYFFVKFKIDTLGQVRNISSNLGASVNIAESFKKAVLSTSGHWKPFLKNKKVLESPFLILPIYVHLQTCKPALKLQDTISQSFNSLHKFDDKTSIENELCIFLKPAILVSVY